MRAPPTGSFRLAAVLSVLSVLAVVVTGAALAAADCNGNGVDDRLDLEPGLAFPGPELILVHQEPSSPDLVIEDLDGDGMPDVASAEGDGIAVLRNLGAGRFAFPAVWPAVAGRTAALAAADLDGDGAIDLAMAEDDDSVGGIAILRNTGAGAFGGAPDRIPGSSWNTIAAADLDGDGRADLAADDGWHLALIRSLPDGRYGPEERLAEGLWAEGIGAADLDRDGDLDLAAASAGGTAILANRGDGRFDAAPAADVQFPLAIADLDGDGLLDLAGGGNLPRLDPPVGTVLLKGRGDRTFADPIPVGPPGPILALSAADLDGDGKADLAILDAERSLRSILDVAGRAEGTAPLGTWVLEASLAAGDLDGDGHPETIVGGALGIELYRGTGTGRFRGPAELDAGLYAGSLSAADLDGDGRQDLAAGGIGGISVLLGTGGGDLAAPVTYEQRAEALLAIDADGDGRPDLATPAGILRNAGAGKFEIGGRLDPPGYHSFVAGDLDGDGSLDLAMAGRTYGESSVLDTALSAFGNDGRGSFGPIEVGGGRTAAFLAAADFDGDGRTELAAARAEGPGKIEFLRAAAGEILPAGLAAVETYPSEIATADFDGDGSADLALPGRFFRNAGKGSAWEAGGLETPAFSWCRGLRAADLDGDGRMDLLGTGRTVALFRSLDGLPLYAGAILRESDDAVAADLDGDGRMDMASLRIRRIAVFRGAAVPAWSLDGDGNGIPDECRPRFHRGDPGGDGRISISDAILLLGFLFLGEAAPGCRESADADDDGRIDIADALVILGHLFTGGLPPAPPGPPSRPCGPDPDPAGSAGDLGCEAYPACL